MALSRRTGDSLSSYNAAATALGIVGTDLESLSSTPGSLEFLVYSNQKVENATNSGVLMFLASSPMDLSGDPQTNGSGQARGIVYRLAFQDAATTNGKNNVYGLYRSVNTNTADVFSNWFTTNKLGSATNVASAPPLDDFLIENVVDFRVRFYPQGSNAPMNTNDSDTVSVRGNGVFVNNTANTNGLATAEITLVVLDDAIVKQRLKGRTLSASEFDDLKRQNGRVLTRRVNLRLPY